MKKLAFILFFLPFVVQAQTFTRKAGDTVGKQIVIAVPDRPAGYAMKQALAYFPSSYAKSTKKYPVLIFLHGAGQAGGMDISQVNGDGLPLLISQGLKPYGFDPVTKDTVEWIVISPHCTDNNQCSFSYPQLQYTIPYILATYRVDPSCLWVGGLSAGGAGTWSSVMGDTVLASKIAGIVPESNGGMDNWITIATYKNNLTSWAKKGGACLYIIGSQDPGDNGPGYGAYSSLMRAACLPGRYADSIIAGGIHDARVWNLPWPQTARIWSKTMNAWTQMWALRRNAGAVKPPASVPHAVITLDSSIINYPNSVVHMIANKSSATNGKIVANDWYLDIGDSRVIISNADSGGVCASGLRPGNYRFKLVVTDSVGNKDSAYATVVLNPLVIPACPVCPPQILCPFQRTVTAIKVNINGLVLSIPLAGTIINYSDGSTQQ